MAQVIINNGDSGLIARTALNGMFTELYGALILPLKLTGLNANTQQNFAANSYIQSIHLLRTAGTPTIRIGTTPNGTDILPDTSPADYAEIIENFYCQNLTTLYITISGGTVNVRFGVVNNFL
jgi:hypothetical protein